MQKGGQKQRAFERRDKDVAERDDVLMANMLEQLELSVCSFGEDRRREGFHDLHAAGSGQLPRLTEALRLQPTFLIATDVLVSWSLAEQTKPKAPMPTGCRST